MSGTVDALIPFSGSVELASDVLNVDLNNFDFDFLVLVNLSGDYAVQGM